MTISWNFHDFCYMKTHLNLIRNPCIVGLQREQISEKRSSISLCSKDSRDRFSDKQVTSLNRHAIYIVTIFRDLNLNFSLMHLWFLQLFLQICLSELEEKVSLLMEQLDISQKQVVEADARATKCENDCKLSLPLLFL